MAFERTPQGQANRARFFQADFVCYVEGEADTEHGVDIAFWTAALEALAPNKTIHVTSRGGKPILEQLAQDIVDRDISGTIVAMDRDYSEFRPHRFIEDRRVFYTFGYSWENDAFCRFQVPHIAKRASRAAKLPARCSNDLLDDQDRLAASVGKVIFADFVALLKGGSVLDRSKPGRYFELTPEGRPRLAIARCRADINAARQCLAGRVMRDANGYPHEGIRYLWGKAFEHYVRMGLKRTVRDFSGRNLNDDHIRDLAIACFAHCLASDQNSPVLDYYRDKWAHFLAGT